MCVRKGIYGYEYFKHIIELCPGVWEDQLLTMDEVVS